MTQSSDAPCHRARTWYTLVVYDTLVLAGGRGWYETQRLAETAVACAVRAVRRLGLNVSPTKSEALGFFDHRTRGAPLLISAWTLTEKKSR
jgi:hypothetical protein